MMRLTMVHEGLSDIEAVIFNIEADEDEVEVVLRMRGLPKLLPVVLSHLHDLHPKLFGDMLVEGSPDLRARLVNLGLPIAGLAVC